MSEEQSFPPSPFAKYTGVLTLGDTSVDCYVLDAQDVDKFGGKRPSYRKYKIRRPCRIHRRKCTKAFYNKDLILAETIDFNIPGTQFPGKGISAERFLEICQAYVAALSANALSTDRQREIAIRCSILLSSCAKVGLIALIDEATGYQYKREEDALQIKLRAFIAEELRAWRSS